MQITWRIQPITKAQKAYIISLYKEIGWRVNIMPQSKGQAMRYIAAAMYHKKRSKNRGMS